MTKQEMLPKGVWVHNVTSPKHLVIIFFTCEGIITSILDKEITHLERLLKESKETKIRNQYNQVSHLTQDTTWESDKTH